MRILLKVSGEAFSGPGEKGYNLESLELNAREIKEAYDAGHEVAALPGGGNIARGSELSTQLNLSGQEKIVADWMGMTATIMNGAALKMMLQRLGLQARLMIAPGFPPLGEPWIRERAIRHLEEKRRVIILACGTGNPRFTTDSGAVLRAVEIGADMVLKGTKVDGIYDKDPVKHPDARHIRHLTYRQFLDHIVKEQPLKIIDATAVTMASENGLPIRVFKALGQGNLLKVIRGEGIYSEISA